MCKHYVIFIFLCSFSSLHGVLSQQEFDLLLSQVQNDFYASSVYFELRKRHIKVNDQHMQILKGHTSPVFCVHITHDNEHIISESSDNTARIWSLPKGQSLYVMRGRNVLRVKRALSVSGDGRLMATGFNRPSVCVWDVATGEPIKQFSQGLGLIFAIALSENGKYLVAAGEQTVVYLWQLVADSFDVMMHSLSAKSKELLVVIFAQEGVYKMCNTDKYYKEYMKFPDALKVLLSDVVTLDCN